MKVEEVECSVLSMEFFDRLQNGEIVRETGQIIRCLDQFVDDVTIADELRRVSNVHTGIVHGATPHGHR